MISIEGLISVHRQDMAMLRSESRQARQDRIKNYREMNKEFKMLRSKVSSEMPHSGKVASFFRAPMALMLILFAVLSF